MKASKLSRTPACLDLLASQVAIDIVAAGRRDTAHAQNLNVVASGAAPGRKYRGFVQHCAGMGDVTRERGIYVISAAQTSYLPLLTPRHNTVNALI